jgi:hypothetical protein
VDSVKLMIHHEGTHINWPCKRCHAPTHPTKLCKIQDGDMEPEQAKLTKVVDGKLPFSLGKSTREFTAGGHLRTMAQLEALLRKEGNKEAGASGRKAARSPTKPFGAISPQR